MTVKAKLEAKPKGLLFQDLILKLLHFWVKQGCVLQQPYDIEVGAGTMHPETFLRVLGPEPYRVAYVQPSRRPADGRYGENPNRLYKHSPISSDPEALARRRSGSLSRESRRHRHRSSQSTTFALRKTTGNRRRWARGELVGKCCWMVWRSRSSRTFSRAAALISTPFRWSLPTAWNASARFCRA